MAPPEVESSRIYPAHKISELSTSPIVIEVGGARVAVKRGFDQEAFRTVLGEAR